jgi:hypothetical protein
VLSTPGPITGTSSDSAAGDDYDHQERDSQGQPTPRGVNALLKTSATPQHHHAWWTGRIVARKASRCGRAPWSRSSTGEDMLRGNARMRSEDTLSGRPQPVNTGRLARTALLVVLIVLALGPSIIDSRIVAESIPVILAALTFGFCVAVSRSAIPSLRATGR